jgi:hypothetical protein
MAANIFTGAIDNNWGTATNWSLGVVPTASDTHTTTFDVTSPNCIVNSSARVCNILDFSGYTNTITMSNGITVSGDITLDSTMASRVAGSGGLTVNATATLTSNGGTWNNALTFAGITKIFTVSDNWNILGTVLVSGAGTHTFNGNNINCNGSLTMNVANLGTTIFNLVGTGTWSGSALFTGILNINTSGTITVSGTVLFGNSLGSTLTHISGTVITTGSTLQLYGQSTLNTSGITWNNISNSAGISATNTLTSNLNCVNLTISVTRIINGLFNINVSGNLTVTTVILSGTATIILNGTGTWSGTGTLKNNLTINASGTTIASGTLNYDTGTLTHISGTVITTGSLLQMATSTTLNTSGITWNNVNFITTTQTCTLLSDLNISGTIGTSNILFTVTINGPYYINCSGSLQEQNGTVMNGTCLGIKMIGTGIWNQNGTPSIAFPVIFDTLGTITVLTMSIIGSSFSLLNGTVLWSQVNNVQFSSICSIFINKPSENIIPRLFLLAGTHTLSSDIYCKVLGTGSSGPSTLNGFNIYISEIFNPVNNTTTQGTTTLNFVGALVSWYANAFGYVTNNININCTKLYIGSVFGRFVLNTTGLATYYSTGTMTHIRGEVEMLNASTFNIQQPIVVTTTTLINFHRVNIPNIIVSGGATLIMNEFFCSRPDAKTKVRSSSTTNYTVSFTNSTPKKAFHVNVRNCTILTRNQLNIVGRDANSGGNLGVLFGSSGMNGFPVNMFPTNTNYPTGNGMLNNMSY